MQTNRTQEIKMYKEPLPNGIGIKLIHIPGGAFQMGESTTGHRVTVPDFFLGKYPVTNQQYLSFVKETGSHHPELMEEGSEYNIYTGTHDYYKKLGEALTSDHHPVVGVSWYDAIGYCQWLSQRSGKIYRLPSEAEWEYAACGGQQSMGFRFAGSNKLKEVGWYDHNSHGATKSVGLKLPNELGLYDMSGNVREWCADHWHENYEGAPKDGSAWDTGGGSNSRVFRGGSWPAIVSLCSVSYRSRVIADLRNNNTGFRLARY